MFRTTLVLLAVAAASAFRVPLNMGMDRRAVIEKFGLTLGAGLTVGANAAFADGAVSDATRARARGLNGPKILATKGEPAAIIENQTAFVLYNAGAIKRKDQKQAAEGAFNALITAAKSGDAASTKAAYSAYLKTTGLDKPSPFKDSDSFQGSSSDFSWTKGSKLDYTYVR
mmetsp:Transcript_2249/g.9737  ORF Transcript_2249/g.9737 Transcript_2249/m.9737 type:complete len:171 (-) Transcript_2249:310-822(-)